MKKLSQVLDNNALNGLFERFIFFYFYNRLHFSEVPKLIEKLRQVSDNQSNLEVSLFLRV